MVSTITPKYSRIKLPRVLDQGRKPACQMYAVAAIAEWMIQQKGHNEQVDEELFYNENKRRIPTTEGLMKICEEKGIPTKSGKRYYVREWGPIYNVDPYSVQNALLQHGALVMSYKIHDGDPLKNRIDKNFKLARRPYDNHAMALIGFDVDPNIGADDYVFIVQNSWGESFADNGCFYMPYVLMRKEYLTGLYWFKLK